jgi:hypothetical protein
MKNYKNYDDTEARQLALKLLNEKHIFDHAINPKLATATAICDIECDNCFIDVKQRNISLSEQLENYHYIGINKDAYLKYNALEKEVYIMYIFNDKSCLIFNAKEPILDKDKHFGFVEDKVYGTIQKDMWNWNISNKLIEYKYEQEQED